MRDLGTETPRDHGIMMKEISLGTPEMFQDSLWTKHSTELRVEERRCHWGTKPLVTSLPPSLVSECLLQRECMA